MSAELNPVLSMNEKFGVKYLRVCFVKTHNDSKRVSAEISVDIKPGKERTQRVRKSFSVSRLGLSSSVIAAVELIAQALSLNVVQREQVLCYVSKSEFLEELWSRIYSTLPNDCYLHSHQDLISDAKARFITYKITSRKCTIFWNGIRRNKRVVDKFNLVDAFADAVVEVLPRLLIDYDKDELALYINSVYLANMHACARAIELDPDEVLPGIKEWQLIVNSRILKESESLSLYVA
ncbi:hypothetical protein [Motilimonas eburnea]|uniref:hypothetical protein n=1 Tax=Motilimonas eburnea TaxID=1737488 RepID=UPI001E3601DD|nr:hypothetical protein [Motilimonas eburnea]MCE2571794.1 hypothetical protein [Motilimonas eburnea]